MTLSVIWWYDSSKLENKRNKSNSKLETIIKNTYSLILLKFNVTLFYSSIQIIKNIVQDLYYDKYYYDLVEKYLK